MDEPLRILCVFSTLDRGGAENMCMNLYRVIDRSKVQFDFVKHIRRKCAFDDEIESLGGRIFIAPRFKGWNIFDYQQWWKNHLSNHPEHKIIHGHYFTISKYYFSICKKYGRITIGHSHSDSTDQMIKRLMIKNIENYADFCLACSKNAGRYLFPHKGFIILKNAIDVDSFGFNKEVSESVKKEFGLEGKYVLGIVSQIREDKNPMAIAEIMQRVCKYVDNAVFLWVGVDAGAKQELVNRINELGLREHFVFTGVRADVNRLLQGMDAFVFPSFWEGLPLSLIEAQASGLPCFISDTLSKEINITGLCTYLPLEKWDLWCNSIINCDYQRQVTRQHIIDAGYDIHTTAAWMQEFYLNLER